MHIVELESKHEIELVFGIHKQGINEFENLGGSNRVYFFLALDSYALMAWCIYEENPEDYGYYLNSAIKCSELVLYYHKDAMNYSCLFPLLSLSKE